MTDRPQPLRTADPIVIALAMAIREIAARRAAEDAARRARLRVMDGGRKGAAA